MQSVLNTNELILITVILLGWESVVTPSWTPPLCIQDWSEPCGFWRFTQTRFLRLLSSSALRSCGLVYLKGSCRPSTVPFSICSSGLLLHFYDSYIVLNCFAYSSNLQRLCGTAGWTSVTCVYVCTLLFRVCVCGFVCGCVSLTVHYTLLAVFYKRWH